MSMKTNLTITTNVYPDAYKCVGEKIESDSSLVLKWSEKRPDDKTPSYYKLEYKKAEARLVVNRIGEVTSNLVFESGRDTIGTISTPYGEMNLHIRTEYINLPSLMSPCLKFCYSIEEYPEAGRNVFTIGLG